MDNKEGKNSGTKLWFVLFGIVVIGLIASFTMISLLKGDKQQTYEDLKKEWKESISNNPSERAVRFIQFMHKSDFWYIENYDNFDIPLNEEEMGMWVKGLKYHADKFDDKEEKDIFMNSFRMIKSAWSTNKNNLIVRKKIFELLSTYDEKTEERHFQWQSVYHDLLTDSQEPDLKVDELKIIDEELSLSFENFVKTNPDFNAWSSFAGIFERSKIYLYKAEEDMPRYLDKEHAKQVFLMYMKKMGELSKTVPEKLRTLDFVVKAEESVLPEI